MIQLPEHPIFEISKEAPLFIIDNFVYSINTEEINYKVNNFNGAPLIEVGSLDELDKLFLERNSERIKKFKKDYSEEIWENELKISSSLSLPQMIYKNVFPKLLGDKYGKNISNLLETPEKRETRKKLALKDKQTLEENLLGVEKRIKKIKAQIEDKPEEKKSSKQDKRLDEMLEISKNIEEHEEKSSELIKLILEDKNIAIINEKFIELGVSGKNYESKVEFSEGKKFYLKGPEIFKKLDKTPKKFKVGERVYAYRMENGDSYFHGSATEGVKIGESVLIAEMAGSESCWVIFDDAGRKGIHLAELKFEKDKNELPELQEKIKSNLEKKLKIEALDQEFTRAKIEEKIKCEDMVILGLKDATDYQEGEFGFEIAQVDCWGEKGIYNIYQKLSPFLVSDYEADKSNYYFFENPRVYVQVKNRGNQIYPLDTLCFENEGVENYNIGLCMGDNDFPAAETKEDQIVSYLKKARDMVTGGFSPDWLIGDLKIIPKAEGKKLGIPIISARTGKLIVKRKEKQK